MGLRYRCILIDHDDTAVDSTSAVHYPAHLEALRVLRPQRTPPTLEQWLLRNFHPGIMEYFVGELAMSKDELAAEFKIWRSWTASRVPAFYAGFLPLLADFRGAGGLVAVISHSEREIIEGHYRASGDPPFLPDLIFGWDDDAHKRKPNPWPVHEALRLLACAPREALIVDDLKPGVLMSQACGVDFAAAGWGHRVPEIERYMREHAAVYCERVEDLRALLFGPAVGLAAHP
jgi:beta-phosphoglucomutase-like phosphatase (HAD superfamily)